MKFRYLLVIAILFGCSPNGADNDGNIGNADTADTVTENSELNDVAIGDVEFRIIASETRGGGDLPQTRRVEVFRAHTELIDKLGRYGIDPAIVNDTDLQQKRVALVSMGWRSGSSVKIRIDEVGLFDDYAQLGITYSFLGNGCVTTADVNIIFLFVEIDTSSEILVREKFEKTDCL